MKPWKIVSLSTSDAAERLEIAHNPDQDCVLLTVIDTNSTPEKTIDIYLDYEEARYFAKELLKWCEEFQPSPVGYKNFIK